MAMNRVQFQPGLSMHAFMDLYGTQEKCEAAVIGWRWPKGYVCPRACAGRGLRRGPRGPAPGA